MITDRMIYLVTEYASGGEIFGKYNFIIFGVSALRHKIIPSRSEFD